MNKQIIKPLAIVIFLLTIIIAGAFMGESQLTANFAIKNQPPSLAHIFGTDNYGRDVFYRTLSGLSKSLTIGVLASTVSGFLALLLGVLAAVAPKWVDDLINFIIDAIMSIPHLVLLILISFSLGRGLFGVTMGVICTHWTGLARIIRSEVLQLKERDYIKIGAKLGTSAATSSTKHMLPHLVPQFIIGVVLLFPHAILHESAVTFLGFGLPPEQPTIGIMLSESSSFILSNMWWLFLPGVALVVVVLLFNLLGKQLKEII